YLTRISQINQKFEKLYQTGDDVIDAILLSKDAIASTCHIELKTSIQMPPQGVINPNDLGNILIHLLDNAINAQHNLIPAEGDRVIMITMNIEQGCFIIEVRNPTNGRERRSQEQLTALSPSLNNGVGLKIVKSLVDQYGGTLQIKHENFFFTVLIRLPVNNNRSESEKTNGGKNCLALDSVDGQPKYH
ncbi:MAG: ATP-binding protein, partial [Sporomusa sp.]